MSRAAASFKRNKEILVALIYCLILALMEIAMFIIQKSSLDGVTPTLLGEIDLRLIFLPCAAMIYMLKGEQKPGLTFAGIYAAATVALAALGFTGVVKEFEWKNALAPIVKAAVLLTACKMTSKPSRIALIAVYAAAEVFGLMRLYDTWSVAVVVIAALLIPAIVLWIKALMPDQDVYTGLYNVSLVFSMQRLLCLAASFICGFLFMILAISLLGSYAALFTSFGIYTILISCVLGWFFAFVLLNLAD